MRGLRQCRLRHGFPSAVADDLVPAVPSAGAEWSAYACGLDDRGTTSANQEKLR